MVAGSSPGAASPFLDLGFNALLLPAADLLPFLGVTFSPWTLTFLGVVFSFLGVVCLTTPALACFFGGDAPSGPFGLATNLCDVSDFFGGEAPALCDGADFFGAFAAASVGMGPFSGTATYFWPIEPKSSGFWPFHIQQQLSYPA